LHLKQEKINLLLLSESPAMGGLLADALKKENYFISLTYNKFEALEKVEKDKFNLAIVDLERPSKENIDILKRIKKIAPKTDIIILIQFTDVKTALNLLKKDVYDYLKKPFIIDELKILIRRALGEKELIKEELIFPQNLINGKNLVPLIGKTKSMQRVFENITKIAKTDITVLIQGETGTGKELVARAIHQLSRRKNKTFLRINCAALPESLLESQLFGYEKGAFTGAIETKEGLFTATDKGTLFLDEICEANFAIQVKLLRVIEYKEFLPVGGTKHINTDVRLVASAKNLKKNVEKKRFREDLYYRLNVFPIFIPPLRERKEDIPLFIHYFLRQHNSLLNKHIKGMSNEALRCLLNYHWPGNVRELENVLLRAVAICKNQTIILADLPEYLRTQKIPSTQSSFLNMSLSFKEAKQKVIESFERKYLENALQKYRGNISQAARAIGIARPLFYEKIKKHKLIPLYFK